MSVSEISKLVPTLEAFSKKSGNWIFSITLDTFSQTELTNLFVEENEISPGAIKLGLEHEEKLFEIFRLRLNFNHTNFYITFYSLE